MNLVYVPAISLERVHVQSTVTPGGPVKVAVKARLYNPGSLKDEVEVSVRVVDPKGATLHTSSGRRAAWAVIRP